MLPEVEQVILLYGQMVGLENLARVRPAHELYLVARDECAERIGGLLGQEDVRVEFLRLLSESSEAEEQDQETRNGFLGEIATRFLQPENEAKNELPEVLQGSPAEVAERLIGWNVQVGDMRAIVDSVLPQEPEQNSRWLSKPIFGDQPEDGMVANYRGHPMLFLRCSVPNSCIRLVGTHTDSERALNPKRVCEMLGLQQDTVLRVTQRDDHTLVLQVPESTQPTLE